MSRFRSLDKESGGYIVPENYTRQVKIHQRLRKQNAAIIREAEAWRKQFRLDNPPLLVRLKQDADGIPAGVPIDAEHELALALIRVREVVPVGDFKTVPSLVIGEDEL